MKKFVNDPKNFVPEMLKGIALANPKTLKYIPEYNLIMRTDIPMANKVSIMQGSGSGHEPAHVMVGRQRHAGCGLPGQCLRCPAGRFRLQDHQAGRLAQRRAAPAQQLHRRHACRSIWAVRWPRRMALRCARS